MSTSTSELSANVAVSSSAVVVVGVLTAVNTHSDPSPSGVASMNATPTAATLSTQPTLGAQSASQPSQHTPPPTLRLRPPNAPLRPTHHHRNPANRNLFGFWANDQQQLELEDQGDEDEVGADFPRSPRSPRSPRPPHSPRSPRSPRSTRDRSASPVRPLGAARSLSPLRSESPSY
jgi:hypothetical protein